ncbi:MAG: hypothetical protein ACOZAL_02645 [Patescibacteria group bacterium]
MPIKSLEQRKRQQILLIVALVIFAITGLVLYFGFWKKEKVVPPESQPVSPEGEGEQLPAILEEKLKRINLDFEFLNQKILSFLKIHGNIPVKKGTTGRENPFIPY